MGLQQYIALDNGIECPNAYIKISRVLKIDFENEECLVEIKTFKDYESRLDELNTILPPKTYLISNNSMKYLKQKVQEVEISLPNTSDDLQIFFTESPQPDIAIVEGADFLIAETTVGTLQNIVDVLNQNTAFSENWTASFEVKYEGVYLKEKYILYFTSKHFVENSQLSTVQDIAGVSGTMFINRSPYLNDSEQNIKEFDIYFGEENLNVRAQGYAYLKNTDDHKTAIDL